MKLEKKIDDLELLATAVHGSLGTLHILGAIYNIRKKNYPHAIVHAIGAIYDLSSIYKHYKGMRE